MEEKICGISFNSEELLDGGTVKRKLLSEN